MKKFSVLQGVMTKEGNGDMTSWLPDFDNLEKAIEFAQKYEKDLAGWVHDKGRGDVFVTFVEAVELDEDGDKIVGSEEIAYWHEEEFDI